MPKLSLVHRSKLMGDARTVSRRARILNSGIIVCKLMCNAMQVVSCVQYTNLLRWYLSFSKWSPDPKVGSRYATLRGRGVARSNGSSPSRAIAAYAVTFVCEGKALV